MPAGLGIGTIAYRQIDAGSRRSHNRAMEDLEQLRYPLGRFRQEPRPTRPQHAQWIAVIEALPGDLRDQVQDLSASQLATPYRPGGWSVCQVVHHLADSHLNAYLRTKLALTEDTPVIKPYDEAAWAELPDARSTSLEPSLRLLEALHARWVTTLRALDDESLLCTLHHPDDGPMTVSRVVQGYAWHSRHHLAHISSLRARLGW